MHSTSSQKRIPRSSVLQKILVSLLATSSISATPLQERETLKTRAPAPCSDWSITLTGSAEFDCTRKGSGWAGPCQKDVPICLPSAPNPAAGGGAISLFEKGASKDFFGTVIECFFNNPAASYNGANSNCDISLVDGYNFDVHCAADNGPFQMGYKGKSAWSQGACNNGGAVLDAANGVCKNTNGKRLTYAKEAPAFFQGIGKEKGVYTVANQIPGPQVAFEAGSKGKHIKCEVSGGMPGYKGRGKAGGRAQKRDEESVESSQLDSQEEHVLRHAHRSRHAHGAI